jgi:hypothetical protein
LDEQLEDRLIPAQGKAATIDAGPAGDFGEVLDSSHTPPVGDVSMRASSPRTFGDDAA